MAAGAAVAVAGGGIALGPAEASPGATTLMSVTSTGGQANKSSDLPSVSDNGLVVAFESKASNLVPGDTNNVKDIFVRDSVAGTTTRVSISSSGGQSDAGTLSGAKTSIGSADAKISGDGRYVTFMSSATNLVSGDINGMQDIFIHDRQTATTTLVSVGDGGLPSNGPSFAPALSADGRYVVFHSRASNLVPGDTNENDDVFLRDRESGNTTRVSVSSDGLQSPSASLFANISADGSVIVFESYSSMFAPVDRNKSLDIFVHERASGTTTRVSVSNTGEEGNGHSHEPNISADGRFVSFVSAANNFFVGDTNGLDDAFVYDRVTAQLTHESLGVDGQLGNAGAMWPVVSNGGTKVSFYSRATNLVEGDTNAWDDVFVRNRVTGIMTRESVDAAGNQANHASINVSMTADGSHVAYASAASNLVAGDTNRSADVFVHALA